jgi:prolyl 4-hydroxylase
MSALVRFRPELAQWLAQALDEGQPPVALVATMVKEQMAPIVAQAIVDAFVGARRAGRPAPVAAVTIEDETAIYLRESPRLASGARLETADRAVRVLARGDYPTLAVLGDLLSLEECDDLIVQARPRLQPSLVVDPDSGQDIVADYRTSLGMFFRLGENDFIARLDRRFAELMNLPIENGEGFQVLCYPTGGATAPHFDFLQTSNAANRASIARSGQRVSTLLAYLNDVGAGGETMFPRAGWTIPPQRGGGLYFEYCNRQGQVDPYSLHAGSRVLAGEKWVATKWMRQRRFVAAS